MWGRAACLSKAEALAIIAASTDFEAYNSEVTTNYLWALSDIIREAKRLYDKLPTAMPNLTTT